ncbi:hypothetical protein NSQ55_05390 [Paenibacillus sp. FSL H7-0943]|uniref:hypothetical protein n=1 Tax=Paenibacillus sp. FSL H7-0943 TaxID=2954739 RepID=UPI0030CD669D
MYKVQLSLDNPLERNLDCLELDQLKLDQLELGQLQLGQLELDQLGLDQPNSPSVSLARFLR